MKTKSCFIGGDINTIVTKSFSEFYPALNKYILNEGTEYISRNGKCKEVINFKTILSKPINRCTVSENRNANIFFHLAESLWIFTGRDDLDFISFFNSVFKEFSDDQKTLNGAYGKRIRKWSHDNQEIDQLKELIIKLDTNNLDRRTVIQLWDASKDLLSQSKDIPCNTQLVFKIQDENLNLTIFNRSNDLHLGLIANIFQFSFLGEIVGLILNKKFNNQTHISNSLHVYTDEKLCDTIKENDLYKTFFQLYPPSCFDLNFDSDISNSLEKFTKVDELLKGAIKHLESFIKNKDIEYKNILKEIEFYKDVSKSVYEIVYLLSYFIFYKNNIKIENIRETLIKRLIDFNKQNPFKHQDYYGLALNYFVKRANYDFSSFDKNMGKY